MAQPPPCRPSSSLMHRRALGFVECACLAYDGTDDHRKVRKATHILEQMPGLTSDSIHAAAAAADVVQVRRFLEERPGCAIEPGGPRDWVPLLYLTYSRVPERDAVEVARLLLDADADPDSFVMLDGTYRFTAITGAIGEGEGGLLRQPPHARARELVELLLDRGANPNDGQGLYNSQFSPGDEWLELLLDRGLTSAHPLNWTDSGMGTLDYVLGQAVTAGQGGTRGVAPPPRDECLGCQHLQQASASRERAARGPSGNRRTAPATRGAAGRAHCARGSLQGGMHGWTDRDRAPPARTAPGARARGGSLR